jgi:serine protease Do
MDRIIKETPGTADPDTSWRPGKPEVVLQLDPIKTEKVGLSSYDVGILLRTLVQGATVSTMQRNNKDIDIILRFDGKAIEKTADLPRAVGNTPPGNRVTLTVFRRGSNRDLSVTVAEVEPEKTAAVVPEKKTPPATVEHLGLTLSDLSDEQRKEARVRAGVRVDAAVDAAARAGIREGDLILAVANAEVASVQLFETLVARMDKTKPVSVLIRRGNAADFVTIRPAP